MPSGFILNAAGGTTSMAAAIRAVACGAAPECGSLVWHGTLALAYVP